MKKALLITTVSGFVPQFEMNSVEILQENGYEVHYATNYHNVFYGKDNSRLDGTGIVRHQIDFSRSPFSLSTLKAYRQLSTLMRNISFDFVHCHTPVAGFIARLAAKTNGIKKVAYTAHGFHFYKGAPALNWILFYPAERLMARLTDMLITINQEDYLRSKDFSLKPDGQAYYIPGAGVNTEKFSSISVEKSTARQQLGLSDDDFVLISVGELNKNKNHETVIRALAGINHAKIKYLICGSGELEPHLKQLIQDLQLESVVQLLGYRKDIPELLAISDVFVFPSLREGLPMSLMEAMAAGKPVIASSIRGNKDLIEDGVNGYLVPPLDKNMFGRKIELLQRCPTETTLFKDNTLRIINKFKNVAVKSSLKSIYATNNIINNNFEKNNTVLSR